VTLHLTDLRAERVDRRVGYVAAVAVTRCRRRGPALAGALVLAVLALVGAACGSSGDDESGATSAATVTTEEATTTSTPPSTTAPATFADGLVARWTDELGDAALAQSLVDGLGSDGVAQFEALVGLDAVFTDPLVAMAPPTVPDDEVDSLVVYAFGNRVAGDGTLSPGPVNEDLAQAVEDFVAEHPVPVFAQWEVADLLAETGVGDVTSIDPDTGPDGEVVYLSTAGVAEKAVTLAQQQGVDLGQVGVIGFQDHAVRCVLTSRAAGMTDAAVPEGVDLPSAYDPQSGQEWTRDRQTYLLTDLQGRLLAAQQG